MLQLLAPLDIILNTVTEACFSFEHVWTDFPLNTFISIKGWIVFFSLTLHIYIFFITCALLSFYESETFIVSRLAKRSCRAVEEGSVANVTDELSFMHDCVRYDETVKAINTGSLSQTPKSSAPAGRQYLRELVNPNIQQAAPQVSGVSNRAECLPCRFSNLINFACF